MRVFTCGTQGVEVSYVMSKFLFKPRSFLPVAKICFNWSKNLLSLVKFLKLSTSKL